MIFYPELRSYLELFKTPFTQHMNKMKTSAIDEKKVYVINPQALSAYIPEEKLAFKSNNNK